ncbi:YfjP family GTPase [Nocardiopsis rhodophaea]|uniref:YfjP family GTPase n=1 Tax=Nocardiopsis rhodophaea TaxID=280238 RepID=A0ABN2SUW6_9ACTN
MTTQRNPAHADEEPDVAEPQADSGASPAPDTAPNAPEAPESAHRARGDDQWTGYVLPAKARRDAGWAAPAGNAWPPNRPAEPEPRSYPALRRAVDMQSGPHPSLADDGEAQPSSEHPGEAEAQDATGDAGGASAAGAPPVEETTSGAYPSLRRAVDRAGDGRARRRTNPDLLADPDDSAGWRTDAAPASGARSGTGPQPAVHPSAPAGPAEAAETANVEAHPTGQRTQDSHDTQNDQNSQSGHGADRADGSRPERPAGGGRHAAPRRHAATSSEPGGDAESPRPPADHAQRADAHGTDPHRRRGDPDDPDQLAAWVGALTETDNATSKIAGRRTGPIPALSEDVLRAMDQEAGKAPEDAAAEEPHPKTGGERADDGPAWTSAADDDDDEYQVSSNEPWQPMPATTREELITRLDALATIVSIGRADFDPDLIARARHLLDHAGARLRLSGDHTVVALAGGTGSGKSSLFNALCGLEFSRVGITRPTTSSAHACVWGNEGADGLLTWLGVPPRCRHSRTSVLDTDNSELSGLILLDLPDHDSVRAMHTAEADRLIGAADLLIWVLDPQKYADAAVHHRYLREMSGYGAVTVAVLNQVDRVEHDELEELLTDLRRLLETESGVQPRVLTTSVLTGQGIRGLRDLLIETVTERRALIDRLVADLDQVIGGFERYQGSTEPPSVSEAGRLRLVTDLLAASGVSAIADTTETAHERRGCRRVGWPVTRWARKLRRDPLRAIRMGFHSDDDERGVAGPVDAHQAEIETATAEIADSVGGSLPAPWPKRLRAAARSNLRDLPVGLGNAISETVPDPADTPLWWQIVRVVQYTLVGTAGAGLAWIGTLLASWIGGGLTGFALLDDPTYLGLAGAVAGATLIVGWLTDVGCRNLVSVAATQRRDQVERDSAAKVRAIADELIIAPLEEELGRYREYREALGTALTKHD